ncbi:hypothetical protein QYE76_002708 [Lolium multiflorum]|uniref:DUF4283 domain-containing protein n=1 Tax=Lolium multiflorum TaxID=4521 RepID=A0AAD8RM80_LOLMU|nr:hypothetical protein QYE76_002708 [Lolium multiflorum]
MASASSAAAGKGSQAKAPSRPRTTSLSPAKGDEELSASLSAKLGDLVLTKKEASGLVIKDLGPGQIPKMKWVNGDRRLDVWVCVFDLPLDMMNRAHGEMIGNWIGKFISVEVDEDGTAWGEELRIRVEVKVDQPLVREVNLRDSEYDKEGKWFDIKGSVLDLPPRRTLFRDRADSGSSRTGGGDQFRSEQEVSSLNKIYRGQLPEKGKDVAQAQSKKPMTYVRRPRGVPSDNQAPKGGGQPPNPPQKKRRSRQMWVPRAELTNEGGEELTLKGKKQKVNSVFDRISVPNDESASPAKRDHQTQ